MLEFADNTLKFYVERGRFKKHLETVREIPLADIEKTVVEGGELSVTWKGVADVFVVEKAESANTICEEINVALSKQVEVPQDEEASNKEYNQLGDLVKGAWDICDSMFDILMNLQGQVNWNLQETILKHSKEINENLPKQHSNKVNLDFKKLTLKIRAHSPEEVAEEAYNILKSLTGCLSDLSIDQMPLQKIHPNYSDAKPLALTYCTLNDIIFGTVVGDEEIEREKNELWGMLGELSKSMEHEINIEAIKRATYGLGSKENMESVVEENRAAFRQQFEGLLTK